MNNWNQGASSGGSGARLFQERVLEHPVISIFGVLAPFGRFLVPFWTVGFWRVPKSTIFFFKRRMRYHNGRPEIVRKRFSHYMQINRFRRSGKSTENGGPNCIVDAERHRRTPRHWPFQLRLFVWGCWVCVRPIQCATLAPPWHPLHWHRKRQKKHARNINISSKWNKKIDAKMISKWIKHITKSYNKSSLCFRSVSRGQKCLRTFSRGICLGTYFGIIFSNISKKLHPKRQPKIYT